jgi:hypothetical protein
MDYDLRHDGTADFDLLHSQAHNDRVCLYAFDSWSWAAWMLGSSCWRSGGTGSST